MPPSLLSRFRAPVCPPALSLMVSALGSPHPCAIARLLDVHERTVYTWMAQDRAPRPALLALFWETPWGRNWQITNAENEARFASSHIAALQAVNQRLTGRVAYLERIGHYGCANAPTFTPSPMWPGLALVR